MRRLAIVLIVLALLTGCQRSAPVLPEPGELSYADPACFTEPTKTEQFLASVITEGTPTVKPDPCLSVAARAIAERMGRRGKDMTTSEIQKLFLSYGIVDSQIGLRTYSAFRVKRIADTIKRNLLDEVKRGDYTHFGVGAFRSWFPPRVCVVLALARRTVYLKPFPKRIDRPEPMVISGRIIDDYDRAVLLLEYPDGRIVSTDLDLKDSHEFEVQLPFNPEIKGTYTVEVEPVGQRGPEVSVLFTVDYLSKGIKSAVDIFAEEPVDMPEDIEEARHLVLLWLNQEREARGLKPLVEDERLSSLAQKRAVRMLEEGLPRHLDPKGRDAAHEAEASGIEFIRLGENLAFNPDLFEAHKSLMESPSHRENILDPGYTHVGVGVAVRKKKDARMFAVVEVFVKR